MSRLKVSYPTTKRDIEKIALFLQSTTYVTTSSCSPHAVALIYPPSLHLSSIDCGANKGESRRTTITMARLNNPRPSTEVSLWPHRATPATELRNPSSSPTASFGSDKENRSARPQGDKTTGKRPMEPPRASNTSSQRANKRRRVTEEGPPRPREMNNNGGRAGSKWFDPDQNPEERRDVRIGSRKLQRDWNGEHSLYSI